LFFFELSFKRVDSLLNDSGFFIDWLASIHHYLQHLLANANFFFFEAIEKMPYISMIFSYQTSELVVPT
jgi:hypothetical protein